MQTGSILLHGLGCLNHTLCVRTQEVQQHRRQKQPQAPPQAEDTMQVVESTGISFTSCLLESRSLLVQVHHHHQFQSPLHLSMSQKKVQVIRCPPAPLSVWFCQVAFAFEGESKKSPMPRSIFFFFLIFWHNWRLLCRLEPTTSVSGLVNFSHLLYHWF